MSLIALAFATALAVPAAAAPAATETPNLYRPPERCRIAQKTVRPGDHVSTPMTRLPAADLHLLVDKRVDGCPVPTIVRYGVDQDGRAPRY